MYPRIACEAVEPRRLLSGGFGIVDLSVSAAAAGVTSATVAGISPDGRTIVGQGAEGGAHVAILWTLSRHGARRVTVLPSNGGDAIANAVNADGVIVGGFHLTSSPSSTEHAIEWHYNKSRQRYVAQDLGTLSGAPAGAGSVANAINASGLVVGQVSGLPNPNDGQNTRADAVAWEVDAQGTVTAVDLSSNLHKGPGTGTGTNLPLDGPFSATAVNDAGTIAGFISTLSGFGAESYVWRLGASNQVTATRLGLGAAAGVSADGSVGVNEDIGDSITANALLFRQVTRAKYSTTLFEPLSGGFRTNVSAMNAAGVAVGTSIDATPTTHSVLSEWKPRQGRLKITDVFSEIPVGSGWTSLDSAAGIDASGDIVGAGTIGGQTHAFLLVANG